MRNRLMILVGAIVTAIAISAATGFAGGSRSIAPAAAVDNDRAASAAALGRDVAKPSPEQKQFLRELARKVALANGGSAPQSGQVIATTRGAANAIDTGATVDTNQDVFMVTLRGRFVAAFSPHPKTGEKLKGTVLSFIYDPAAAQITDISVGPVHPDLTALGEPEPLDQ